MMRMTSQTVKNCFVLRFTYAQFLFFHLILNKHKQETNLRKTNRKQISIKEKKLFKFLMRLKLNNFALKEKKNN